MIGEKIVDCNCPSRVPCKHSAAAIALHVHVAAHLANNIRKGDAH
ncbi:MAG: SWIM zinc finger family protein [Acidobacteriota bacterium]|nr:SWIM zinc finger family protein [Acidobacteriota bacterium]